MANFLTNLAKRSFGAESAIRPYRASLFEPASSIPGNLNPPAAEAAFETNTFHDAEAEATRVEPERDRSRPSPRPTSVRGSLPIESPSLEAILSLQDESEAGPLTPEPV